MLVSGRLQLHRKHKAYEKKSNPPPKHLRYIIVSVANLEMKTLICFYPYIQCQCLNIIWPTWKRSSRQYGLITIICLFLSSYYVPIIICWVKAVRRINTMRTCKFTALPATTPRCAPRRRCTWIWMAVKTGIFVQNVAFHLTSVNWCSCCIPQITNNENDCQHHVETKNLQQQHWKDHWDWHVSKFP